jgi:tetratricopeptide (TPR) repeat protein
MKPLADAGAKHLKECSTSGRESGAVNSADPDRRAKDMVAEGCEHEHALNWHAAIGCYKEAVLADAQDPRVRYFAHNNLGYSLIQLHRYDEAEEHCEAAIAVNPAQYNAHKNLGLAREGQGRWLDAALSLAEAARHCPEDPRAWLHLQKLLAERPELHDQSPELALAVAEVQAIYEKKGVLPRLN